MAGSGTIRDNTTHMDVGSADRRRSACGRGPPRQTHCARKQIREFFVPLPASAVVRLLIHGDDAPGRDWLNEVLRSIPQGTATTLCGRTAAGDNGSVAAHWAELGANTSQALLAAARERFPGEHIALLRAGTSVPPFWLQRLLGALGGNDTLVVMPLDNVEESRSPLATGARCELAPEAIDRLVCAYATRRSFEVADVSPLLSLWHGERLQAVDLTIWQRGALPARWAPLRASLIDHLYVADATRTLRGPAPTAPGEDPPPSSPLGELRSRMAAALATQQVSIPAARHGIDGKPVLLHVLHGWGGGAERFVRDLAAADTDRAHLVLIARGHFARRRYGEVLELYDGALSGPALRRLVLPLPIADTAFANNDYRAFLNTQLRDYGVGALMLSSLIGHSLDALRTGLPTLVIAHDVYPLWPVLHRDFGDISLAFDAHQRVADLRALGSDSEFAERDPAHWAALRDAYVSAACDAKATLVAPSRSALANVLRLAPEWRALPQQVIAHGLAAWPGAPANAPPARGASPKRESSRLRLIVPGRVRRGKGAELLRAALPALREHAEIFLLGAGADGMDFFGERDVHVLLNYRREELPQLIATLQPDAALILPTVAETFSYTFSECASLGLPVIATRVGALAERITDGETGFLVDVQIDAIVSRVAQLRRQRGALAQARERLLSSPVRSLVQMAADYAPLLAGIRVPLSAVDVSDASVEAQCAGAASDLAATRAVEIAAQARRLLAQQRELDARAEWAMGLEREQKKGIAALKQLQAEFDDRSHWAQQMSDELESLRPAFERVNAEREQMKHSASWRITAPLRALKQRLRLLRQRLRALRTRVAFHSSRVRTAWLRTRGSLARRGLVGTYKRAMRELRRSGRAAPVPVAGAPDEDAPFEPFTLPTVADVAHSRPRVSIVIPVYNKVIYTLACLRSLAAHADATPFEVIVVDDCSSDETPQRLAQIGGVRLLRNTQNLGFVGSCNAGAAAARGEFLFFLNNDTVVTPGWIAALLRCFEEEADCGLVGARLVYPDGRLQEAGGIVFRDGSGWNYGRFDDPADPRYGFRREADYCSGAAILLRRALFEQLGGFDARYAPAYYEDTDLAFAVRAAGKKVFYEPRATVIHFEGISAGTDTGSGMKRFQVVNRDKFMEKWKDALLRQPAPIDDPKDAPNAATFRAQKRMLIIDACTPTPDQDSGSLRMVNVMRLLRASGWQTTFFASNLAWMERYTDQLQALGVEVQYHPWLEPVNFFRARGTEFDAVLLSRHYVALDYFGLARLYAPQARLIFDTVDLHYLREQREAELAGSAELKRKATVTRAQEHKLMRECDVTIVVSPVEKELLARELPAARVEILSNVHEVFGCRRPFGERQDLCFVGSFAHPPNEDAVLWFASEVLPRVREKLPQVRFNVIGGPMLDNIAALAGDAVVVHGFVPDLEPFMDGCRISVAPLRYGAGVKGKVNMAMSYGLPVVATPMAVEGMHLVAGEEALVADGAEAYAAAIVQLYGDEALWQRLSRGGLANVERHFSFAAAQKALARILQ